ncbi:DUF2510 domain-containing protein [Streptomyces chromofuscus]|uniref:DUF2510 domain-containing protein n=1 Tax=Streptomyces chromofuscus TaxID=42881 RepID=A0A7M2TEE8_STRCW|nr:DUF2510 domain-containing protein [Streptomyces chromofuscus]QOV45691.1 DUF2510 domain-containing protein [Streptomyces chromofuscus]GGT17139.1 hypothetical protein GCM10010254_42020 [Streptomyces chromofuscus]
MSTTPPPGWYRDPSAPHLERWWDGTAWTEHRRPPEPAGPPPPAARGARSPRARAGALTAAGILLVAVLGTAVAVLGGGLGGDESGGDGSGGTRANTAPPTAATTAAPPPSEAAPAPSTDDPAVVVDELNGITLPLLDGWVRPENISVDHVMMTTDGTYDCPGDAGVCRHGLVISRTATETDETSPEALAKADIADAADEAYDRDVVGRRPYGGIESHRVVKAGPVAVAGRAGYFVRWRVDTAEGPGGYVQSLAFQSSVGTEAPVIVRYVFDAGPDGPPPSDMDRITDGIRPVGDADTGGGVGAGIGPTG